MIQLEISCRKFVMLLGCLVLLSAYGCAGSWNKNGIAISYTEQIQKLPGGVDNFWPEGGLKKAFTEYWNIRYSDAWKDSFEREAPYFQEIVSRTHYEGVIRNAVGNRIEGIVILSIQKVTNHFYEIQIVFNVITPKNEKKESYFTDRWVYAGESWYHVMRDPILFQKAS